MNLYMEYDSKTNTSIARKVVGGKTDYYIGIAKICPNCGKTIIGYSALSRKDNKTEICSKCGKLESLEYLIKYEGTNG